MRRTRRRWMSRSVRSEVTIPASHERGGAPVLAPLAQFAIVHGNAVDCDGMAGKSLTRYDGHCPRHAPVLVAVRRLAPRMEVPGAGAIDKGIRMVDATHVTRRMTIPGAVDFMGCKGEPAYAAAHTTTQADHHAQRRPACPADQRGGIDRAQVPRPRHPAPAIAYLCPTAIVEGRESPARIVHPGPAPRADPCPPAITVGCPVRGGMQWSPHLPIFRFIEPFAVLVQILVADDIGGDMACRA